MNLNKLSIAMVGFSLLWNAASAVDRPYAHANQESLPSGMIGVSPLIGADRLGDPALLYVGMVHPEGPAHRAGLAHGDEIVAVDGTSVAGKSYEQAVKMIRGVPGSFVTITVRREQEARDLAVTRIAGDALSKGPMGPHGGPDR